MHDAVVGIAVGGIDRDLSAALEPHTLQPYIPRKHAAFTSSQSANNDSYLPMRAICHIGRNTASATTSTMTAKPTVSRGSMIVLMFLVRLFDSRS